MRAPPRRSRLYQRGRFWTRKGGRSSLRFDNQTFAIGVTDVVEGGPAVITGTSTGDVIEAGGMNNGTVGTPTATGNLDSTDTDNPNDAWQSVAPGAVSHNGYGTYAVTADGVWTYTLNNNHAAVQALNCDGTLTDTFDVRTEDGTRQTVTITIHGQDDAPTIGITSFDPDGPCPLAANAGGGLPLNAVISSFQSDAFDFSGLSSTTGVRAVDGGFGNDPIRGGAFDDNLMDYGGADRFVPDLPTFGFNSAVQDRPTQIDRDVPIDVDGGGPQQVNSTGISMLHAHSGDFLL